MRYTIDVQRSLGVQTPSLILRLWRVRTGCVGPIQKKNASAQEQISRTAVRLDGYVSLTVDFGRDEEKAGRARKAYVRRSTCVSAVAAHCVLCCLAVPE